MTNKTIVSIDVGIKNLSTCVFSKINNELFDIIHWDNINLMPPLPTIDIAKCTKCTRNATYQLHTNSFCTQHAKKHSGIFPSKETKITTLKSKTIDQLLAACNKYYIPIPENYKKNDLVGILQKYYDKFVYTKIQKQKNPCNQVSMISIGRNIQSYFDNLFPEQNTIDVVLIENQIGPLAIKMKTIQGMITQYFLMRNNPVQVEFVSSNNKLKPIHQKIIKYSDRKKAGIILCKYILNKYNMTTWLNILTNHTKKDDLSDCFLQVWVECIWAGEIIILP